MQMLRSVLSKVAWVGRTASMVFGLALVLALMFGVASMAFAANGQNFILGSLKNSATAVSKLTMTGTASGAVLQLVQKSTGLTASGLGITVPAGKAPITVNSAAGKATNLNADKIDNLDSTQLQQRVSGTCAAGQSISSIGVAGTVTCETDDDSGAALRSELGTSDWGPNEASDPVSYTKVKDIPPDVVNRNADTLDGKNSTDFANSTHSHSGADITSGTVAEARIDSSIARDSEITTGFGMTNVSATLVFGTNNVLGPAFTPSASGRCLVTVSTQIQSSAANTSIGPYYRIAIKRGDTTSSTGDNLYGHYFLPTSSANLGNLTSDMTRSAVVNVTGGQATQFGAYLGATDANWAGDLADVHITYWCTTASGTGGAAAAVSAAAVDRANNQEN